MKNSGHKFSGVNLVLCDCSVNVKKNEKESKVLIDVFEQTQDVLLRLEVKMWIVWSCSGALSFTVKDYLRYKTSQMCYLWGTG